eukprot:1137061-Pelagomonas_calceolata.AAC.2
MTTTTTTAAAAIMSIIINNKENGHDKNIIATTTVVTMNNHHLLILCKSELEDIGHINFSMLWACCTRGTTHPPIMFTWKIMGAKGLAIGVLERVALFRMAASRPPMASTLPAGTACVCCHAL